jgi:hypothetical protein
VSIEDKIGFIRPGTDGPDQGVDDGDESTMLLHEIVDDEDDVDCETGLSVKTAIADGGVQVSGVAQHLIRTPVGGDRRGACADGLPQPDVPEIMEEGRFIQA